MARGFNYRLTDVQAALGSSQLKRIKEFVARRQELAGRYFEALRGLPLDLPVDGEQRTSSWHLYVVQLRSPKERRGVFDYMRKHGVLVNVHYIPVHLQPYYRRLGFKAGDFPQAERFYDQAISGVRVRKVGLRRKRHGMPSISAPARAIAACTAGNVGCLNRAATYPSGRSK